MSDSPSVSAFDRFGLTLFLAAAWHAVIILGVSFTVDPPGKAPPPERTLEIMVVQNRTEEKKPEKADFLAQSSQEGGGEEKEVVRPKTEMLMPSNKQVQKPIGETRRASMPNPPQTPPKRKVISTPKEVEKKVAVAEKKRPPKPKKKKLSTAQILASTDKEIARLTAELDRKTKAYAKRPRRKHISASTREYKYANYLDAWKRKVERIGNLNYPEEAKKRRLYGDLMLHVALKPDGTIHSVQVRKSSGHKLLDDAAIRIVKLAAPYAPFPKEIREETDILDITRTWQFLSSNRLLAK
jgi:protein TonB